MLTPSRLGEVSQIRINKGANPIDIRRGESGVITPSRLGEVSLIRINKGANPIEIR